MATVQLMSKRLIAATAVIAAAFVLLTHSTVNAIGPTRPSRARADGAALFAAKCSGCHGKDGRGLPNWRAKGQPDFSDVRWQSARTDAQISQSINDGKGKFMPAWRGKLSADEIGVLVKHIRALRR